MMDQQFIEALADDLGPFADIGTDAPSYDISKHHASIRYFRKGVATELKVFGAGHIEEVIGDETVTHANFRALLASERYGDLRTWAARQAALFNSEPENGLLIPAKGTLNQGIEQLRLEEIDTFLSTPPTSAGTRVLLIDGPAGIGKTYFISRLVKLRCEAYASKRLPLVLHIQSRGRTLSYLLDLLAFSLQRLRLDVTFDQVPVLAKHGLITIAIDGFDELADPDGYGGAWQQVSELIASVRGHGVIILAGRETFIGRDRILKDVSSLSVSRDEISVLTLNPPSKSEAMNWLGSQGWEESHLQAVEDFLEPTSLALRPFFLKTLSDQAILHRIANTESTSILSILVEAMIDREAGKFGEEVEREMSLAQRRQYVRSMMAEVARDLAENSVVSVSDSTLAFLSEIALPAAVGDAAKRILKQRVGVIAFLTNDERAGYRRFYHEKFYEYFLSGVIVEAVIDRSAIKPISRGLFASSFLETFGEIAASALGESQARAFLHGCRDMLDAPLSTDRTRRNVASFMIASLSIAELVDDFVISDVEVDEIRFTGVATKATLERVLISQWDCRGADLSEVEFSECQIVNVIGDDQVLLSNTFPTPNRVQIVEQGRRAISAPDEIVEWRNDHLKDRPAVEGGLVPNSLRDHEAIKVLHKACRYRQYWLRRGDDVFVARILDNEHWPIVEHALVENDLITIEARQASGTDARFLHIKTPWQILNEDETNSNVVNFYRELVAQLSPGEQRH